MPWRFLSLPALIFATALETGDTLLSGNAKHFKEVPLLDSAVFRA